MHASSSLKSASLAKLRSVGNCKTLTQSLRSLVKMQSPYRWEPSGRSALGSPFTEQYAERGTIVPDLPVLHPGTNCFFLHRSKREEQGKMRVVDVPHYGGPEVLRIGEASQPKPGPEEVLI